MGQPTNTPPLEIPESGTFCPACGEPFKNGKVKHDEFCPYVADDIEPEECN